MVEYIEARGGKVHTSSPVKEIVTNDDGSVKHLLMRSGEIVVADEYISSMPADIMKRFVPKAWSTMPFFRQMDELEGIPVINLHMWFDRKLKNVDHLCFSRSPLLSVYADMSTTCKEYASEEKSMLELVFAPCSPIAGGDVNWIAKSDEEIIAATMGELARLFPTEVAADGSKAKLLKYAVVKVPRSVYAAVPGRNKFRPSQRTPIPNFTLAGCYTSQKFLGSMEGAVLAGKLAAEVVSERAAGVPHSRPDKPIEQSIIDRAAKFVPKDPPGVLGVGPIAFGGGASLTSNLREEMQKQDPDQLIKLG
jgi:15-cis-phytoene desaturase